MKEQKTLNLNRLSISAISLVGENSLFTCEIINKIPSPCCHLWKVTHQLHIDHSKPNLISKEQTKISTKLGEGGNKKSQDSYIEDITGE